MGSSSSNLGQNVPCPVSKNVDTLFPTGSDNTGVNSGGTSSGTGGMASPISTRLFVCASERSYRVVSPNREALWGQ